MAGMVVDNALFRGRHAFSKLVVPWATYTEPEVAHVGLYERDVASQGLACDTYTTALAHCQSVVDGGGECFVRETNRAATGCVPKIIGTTGQGWQQGIQSLYPPNYVADAATCEDAGLRTATEWECETVTGSLHTNYLGLGHKSNQGPYMGLWDSPTGYPFASDSMPSGCVPITYNNNAFHANNHWVAYNAQTTSVSCNGDGLIASASGWGGYAGCVCCDYAPVGDWEACTC